MGSNQKLLKGQDSNNVVSISAKKVKAKELLRKKETSDLASNIYDSYLSTPNFLKRLCEIADSLIGIDNKKEVLNEALRKLNK